MKKHNLWIGLLWFCGLVLVTAAFSAQLWLASFWYPTAYAVSPGPVVTFLQGVADAMVSPALYVGFGTIGGLLFLHARNHARRRSADNTQG